MIIFIFLFRKSIASSSPYRSSSRNTDMDEDQTIRRPMFAKRSAGAPQRQELPAAKVQRRNTDVETPVALARKTVLHLGRGKKEQ